MHYSHPSIETGYQSLLRDFTAMQARQRSRWSNLLSAMPERLRSHQRWLVERRQENLHDFNLFQMLGIHEREVKTHSAMLAWLFNPTANHGQGNLFLRSFWHILQQQPNASHLPDLGETTNDHAWVIRKEFSVGDLGQIDIHLENPGLEMSLVIENKIYAGDQKAQLLRYHKHQERHFRNDKKGLIYLTLDGTPPSEDSCHDSETGEAIRADQIILLGYRPHIRDCLEETYDEIHAPHLKFILQQYIDTIERL